MTRIELLESLLEEIEELESLEEVKKAVNERLEEAYELQERKMMASESALFDNDDDDTEF